MRHTSWLLIVLAGTGGAQWRRFGEGRQAVASSSLARGTLAAHNAVRARVEMAPLAWSDRLAARSQDWAEARTLTDRRRRRSRAKSSITTGTEPVPPQRRTLPRPPMCSAW